MGVNERNSRILMVFSIIVGILFISKYLFSFVFFAFQEINLKEILSSIHFLALGISSSWFLTMGLAIVYCYMEALSLSNNTRINIDYYKNYADYWYTIFIKSFFYSIIFILFLFGIISLVPISKSIVIVIFAVISLYSFIGITILLTNNKKFRLSSKLGMKIKAIRRKYNIFDIAIYWALIFTISFLLIIPFGILKNYDANLKFDYIGNTINTSNLKITFSDITSERIPDEIIITIINNDTNSKEILLTKYDFLSSQINSNITRVQDNVIYNFQEEMFSLKNSSFKAICNLDLSNYLKEGINTIKISFLSAKIQNKYELINTIIVKGTQVEYIEDFYDLNY